MPGWRRLFSAKFLALFLTLLLLGGDLGLYAQESTESAKSRFSAGLEYYRNGLYHAAVARLESLLAADSGPDVELKAKVYLLLGACYERLDRGERARQCFLELKKMVESELIDRLPEIVGIDAELLVEYQRTMGEKDFFIYKEPIAVADVMKRNVIHAPINGVEQRIQKRKRKFPWLLAAGAAVVAGAAVLFFKRKNGEF